METVSKEEIKKTLFDSGFDLVGIAPAAEFPYMGFYEDYLGKGFHAEMEYLARTREKRIDLKKLFPSARSIICCAVSYNYPENDAADGAILISRYANRRDYHLVLKEMLLKATARISGETKAFIDTESLFEKWHAYKAGLGCIGKNSLLINRRFGSWIFLGVILSSLELEPDVPDEADGCGDCSLCIDACPTGAIKAPYLIDSRRCIAYLNNDFRGAIPEEFHRKLSGWLFGCDICQEVCPHNRNAAISNCPALKPLFRRDVFSRKDILRMTDDDFLKRFKDTPIERRGLELLKRTALLLRD